MNTFAARPPRMNISYVAEGDKLFTSWCRATAAAAFFLLFAGGMVTSTGSGLAVPDWPLSFGGMNPPMVGGIFFEHGHRLIAGFVSLMTLGCVLLSRRSPLIPSAARSAANLAAGGILIQAALGGLTVLLKLPPAVSIAHACLGQAVFCVLFAAAVLSVPVTTFGPGYSRVFRFSVLGFSAAYLQLALGALVRHTGTGLSWHILWACSVVVLAALASFTAWRSAAPALRRPALLLAVAVPLQIALGLFALRVRVDSALILGFREAAVWRTAHLSGGALTLAAFLLLALRSRRTAQAAA